MSTAATLPVPVTLDELTRMGPDALGALYREGSVPPLDAVSGIPHGRMLALDGPAGGRGPNRLVRRIAGSRLFPWKGKAFAHIDSSVGTGINRVIALGELYPFDTRIEPSVLDGRPTVLLDYDKPENPWFIRRIRDEIRQVAPGLFLGPALVRFRGQHHRALHFAIDHNTPARG